MGGRRILTVTLAALVACGDRAPLGPQPVTPCTGSCVSSFPINPHHYLLAVGDTVRFRAKAKTADGVAVPVAWTAGGGVTNNLPVTIDAGGLARALVPGRGFVYAQAPNQDPNTGARAEIWVVSPDTSAQPFIALMRDAATGDTIPYGSVLVGRDSVDVVISYVVGNFTNTRGTPAITLQVRIPGALGEVYSEAIPAPVRGRSATATIRLNLRQRTAAGVPVFTQRTYDLYVLLPLADGRNLGDQTGYPTVC